MTWFGKFERFCEYTNCLVESAIGTLAAVMVLTTFAQVFCRYVLGSSLTWSEELARYIFMWVIFLGTSCAMRRGQHMAVEGILEKIPNSLVVPFKAIIALTNATLFIIIVYTGLLLARNAMSQVSTALEISIAYVYAAAPIGAALTLLHIVNGIAQIFDTHPATADAP